MVATQELIKSGMARRVGSGANVDVETDPWLPCQTNPYISTSNEALKGTKVISLMAENHNTWDVDLIHDIFNERDANLILSIPIQSTDNDSWFWRKDKMGQYTVKSAYDVLRDNSMASNASINKTFWTKLWHLKIPLKVKHFMWRAILCE